MSSRRLELIYERSDDAVTDYDEMSCQIEALAAKWKPGTLGRRYFEKFTLMLRAHEEAEQKKFKAIVKKRKFRKP